MELDFTVVLRGFDREAVDRMFAQMDAALESADPVARSAAAEALRGAVFPVRFRGYDRGQVDAARHLVVAELLGFDR